MRNFTKFNMRGQSTLEFTIIIACIVAALLAMQVYIKRAVQGKLRSAADDIGRQYDPKNTISDIIISQNSDVTTTIESEEVDGELKTTTTVTINSETEERRGFETVGELGSSLF